MPDKSWKAWVRTVARIFGGRRRGPVTRSDTSGLGDIIAEGFCIEVKLLGRPSFSDLLAACYQAERNAAPLEMPVAVVKKKGANRSDALCIYRLPTFQEWFLTGEDKRRGESGGE